MKCKYANCGKETGMKPFSAREWKYCEEHRAYFREWQRKKVRRREKTNGHYQ